LENKGFAPVLRILKNVGQVTQQVFDRRPVYYLIHVTGRCNAKCGHCFYWQEIQSSSDGVELRLDEFEKLSQHMGPLLLVNLCGGEPYLRDDLPEIAHIFCSVNDCRMITIPSNGSQTDRIVEYAARMCSENPNTVFRFAFSLDGPRAMHDAIRGVPGLFDRTCQTIREVARLHDQFSNFAVLTSTVFSSQTQDHILDFLDWIEHELPGDQTNVTFIRGNPMDLETLQVKPKIYDQVIARLKSRPGTREVNRQPDALVSRSMFLNTLDTVVEANKNPDKRCFECFAGRKHVIIDRRGDIQPCEILENGQNMGNVRDFDYDIQALLASPRAQEVVRWIGEKHCACTWECAIQASKLFDRKQWLSLATRTWAVRFADEPAYA
jgi:MoaA/NifB/PqqE/SkfB family radical SAM enzyme